jgi:hypothetical protein
MTLRKFLILRSCRRRRLEGRTDADPIHSPALSVPAILGVQLDHKMAARETMVELGDVIGRANGNSGRGLGCRDRDQSASDASAA